MSKYDPKHDKGKGRMDGAHPVNRTQAEKDLNWSLMLKRLHELTALEIAKDEIIADLTRRNVLLQAALDSSIAREAKALHPTLDPACTPSETSISA